MRASLPLILLTGALLGCAQPSNEVTGPKSFAVELGRYMAKLESDYAAFEPPSPQRDSASRRLVWSMLAMPIDPAENQQLSDRFAAALTASDRFRMYDRDIMLIGSQVLKDYPPTDRSYLAALARKINNARGPDAPIPYKTEYSSLAVGLIIGSVDYPQRVDTYEDRVNYDQWDQLDAWLNENLQTLRLDPQTNRYRLPGAENQARTTRPSPTLDDPGR